MNVLKWIEENIDKLNSENYISVHLDELNVEKKYLQKGIEILKIVKENIETINIELSEIKIEIQYELLNTNNIIKGVPSSLTELKNKIDKNNPPELIISKRQKGYLDYIPKIEYYISPLPFLINELETIFSCYYTEYRTIDDLLENEVYSSWFNIIWIKNIS